MNITDDGVDDGLAAADAEVCRATFITSLFMRDCSVDVMLNLDDILGDLAGDSGGDDDAPDSGADVEDSPPPDCLLRYVRMVLLWVICLTSF